MIGLTGGVGVGKTTHIERLREILWEQSRVVCVPIDYAHYGELSSPPEITDFLLSLVGGFAEQAVALGDLPTDWDRRSVGVRLKDILGRLQFPDLEAKFGVVGAEVTVQELLREDESFRVLLRNHLRGRVSEVIREAQAYAGEISSAILRNKPNCGGVALVLDSTEKLSAPGADETTMHQAVRNLFVQNGDNLRLPECHTLYLLPPWVPVKVGIALRFTVMQFPTVRVIQRDGAPDPNGLSIMHEIVRRRIPDVEEFISREDLQCLYSLSGGVQRALFRLLRNVARAARRAERLPIESEIVSQAIAAEREGFLAITIEASPWLDLIARTGSLDGLPADGLTTLDSYFQSLAILQYANGSKWYAIHPLLKDRLARAREVRQSPTGN